MDIVSKFSYGMYIVTAFDGAPRGCVCNCAVQITAEPATFAISLNRENLTRDAVERTGKFAVSVLAVDSDKSLIGTFGFKSGRTTDKFASVKYSLKDGLPVIDDCCGYIACEVFDKTETPTHTVFFGKVISSELFSEREPMTYDYYHKVIKGSAPKTAPTYLPPEKKSIAQKSESPVKPAPVPPAPEQPEKKRKFICTVCGYEYEGDELPADFVCPICGMGVDAFVEEK